MYLLYGRPCAEEMNKKYHIFNKVIESTLNCHFMMVIIVLIKKKKDITDLYANCIVGNG